MCFRTSGLLRGFALAGMVSVIAFAGGKGAPAVGRHKDFRGLDIVEVKESFKTSDYTQVCVEPFDLSPIEIPPADENTHPVVMLAKEQFHVRFLNKVKAELNPLAVVEAQPGTTPAASATTTDKQEPSKVLLVRGVVTKLSPGSAAGRAFFGIFGGGQARVEITCEILDKDSGRVLATLVQARVGSMSGGFGYDRLIQTLTEEVGEDVAKMVKLFR